MKFMGCFGGAAAVADEAAVVARHRSRQRRGMRFGGRFVSGEKGKESPSLKPKVLAVEDIYGMFTFGAAKSASVSVPVPSSSALSSSASLDSACPSPSSSSCSSSRSSSSSSSSFSEVTPPPAKQPAEKRSPAAGAAAVLLCLVMIVFCGRFAATLLASAAFYLLPRRWPARVPNAESMVGDGVAAASTSPVASWRQEETMKRKVVMGGFLVRNRKN